MKKVGAVQCLHQTNMGVSHTYSSICRDDIKNINYVDIVPSSESRARKSNFVEAIPTMLRWPVYKLDLEKWITEKKILSELNRLDAVYLWPEVSISTIDKIKGKVPIVIERVNCFQGKAKKILDEEFVKNGIRPNHKITDDKVDYEKNLAEKADYIFCPSSEVYKSFLEINIPESKLLRSTYGWCNRRFNVNVIYDGKEEKIYDFVFVGRICVRKGSHLLIKYFAESNVKGTLLLCGKMDQDIVDLCGSYLACDNIKHVNFTKNVTDIYKKSKVFVFPTLEEGDPLVTYEAMLHGLPVLTTPMGAGSAVRDNIDGWIIDPHNQDQWISKFRELSDNFDSLEENFYIFKERMNYFEFRCVSERRADILNNIT